MSRFFATGSDSESDSASEEEQVQRAPTTAFTVNLSIIIFHYFLFYTMANIQNLHYIM